MRRRLRSNKKSSYSGGRGAESIGDAIENTSNSHFSSLLSFSRYVPLPRRYGEKRTRSRTSFTFAAQARAISAAFARVYSFNRVNREGGGESNFTEWRGKVAVPFDKTENRGRNTGEPRLNENAAE